MTGNGMNFTFIPLQDQYSSGFCVRHIILSRGNFLAVTKMNYLMLNFGTKLYFSRYYVSTCPDVERGEVLQV